jgi:hypothetical protein
MAADFMARESIEVLDDNFSLLRDVVWMQPRETRERLGRLLALDVLILGTFLEQFIIDLIGNKRAGRTIPMFVLS